MVEVNDIFDCKIRLFLKSHSKPSEVSHASLRLDFTVSPAAWTAPVALCLVWSYLVFTLLGFFVVVVLH